MKTRLTLILLIAFLGACGNAEDAPDVRVAVAANFLTTFKEIAARFEAETGHRIEVTSGSTGALYAQISNGAPIDVFLSADARRPAMLERAGLSVPGSRRTYARGRLALISDRHPSVAEHGAESLRSEELRTIAIANPATAPYGLAARQALERSHLAAVVEGRLVEGTSVGQVFSMVLADADAGFVALSQALVRRLRHVWVVPEELHDPIFQDAVIVKRARSNETARALLDFLSTDEAVEIIHRHGYGTDDR